MTDDGSATLLPFPLFPPNGADADRTPSVPGPALDAYRLLARAGRLTPGQVAAGIALPADRTQQALAELVGLRLVREVGDGTLVAVPHPQAVEDVLADQARLLAHAVEQVAAGSRQLDALLHGRSPLDPGRPGGVSSTVLGASVDAQASGLFRDARESVIALRPGPVPGGQDREEELARAAECRDRGVRMRVVHETAALHDPAAAAYLDRLEAVGCRVRVRDRLPFPLLLVDGTLCVCALPDQGSFLLTGEHLLVLLTRIFETSWVDARPPSPPRIRPGHLPPQGGPAVPADGAQERPEQQRGPARTGDGSATQSPGPRPPGRGGAPGPVHVAVLRLLADGHTDRSIARTLGITTRTLTRRIGELYDLLGVGSRFQAGIVAKERGIV